MKSYEEIEDQLWIYLRAASDAEVHNDREQAEKHLKEALAFLEENLYSNHGTL